MLLFAQAPAGGPPPNWIWGVVAAVGACYLFGFLLVSIVLFFFLRTWVRTLDRCAPDLRTMEPGSVWLNVIPFFNLVWLFVTVIRVSDSLRLEFADRRLDEDEDGGGYGKTLGLAGLMMLVLTCGSCCLPLPLAGGGGNMQAAAMGVGVIRMVVLVALLVVFVLYWVRVAGYGRQLADDDDRHYATDDDRPPREEPSDDPPR